MLAITSAAVRKTALIGSVAALAISSSAFADTLVTNNVGAPNGDNTGCQTGWDSATNTWVGLVNTVAIGCGAGNNATDTSVAPPGGQKVGSSIFIGRDAGANSAGYQNAYIGDEAGRSAAGANNFAAGPSAFEAANGNFSVAIGSRAALGSSSNYSVALGQAAGNGSTLSFAVTLGNQAGSASTLTNSFVGGNSAGMSTSQGR